LEGVNYGGTMRYL